MAANLAGFMFVITLLVAYQAAARVLPGGNNAGLTDQKNFVSFGGTGGYSGIGDSGIPFGGVFGGAGAGGGSNGFNGIGGIIGTGPNGGSVSGVGTFPGGVGGVPGGVTLPHP